MREARLQGLYRPRRHRATIRNLTQELAGDLLNRQFAVMGPIGCG